ncbi:TolC family protein [Shimia haliotis]|uniref:Protein CyaE n=1 Tax=Shimia haliotis TaxID=1280847 RepID=A0A1I4HMT1_9RHOB|nr:TolC family protein [Shimia haliotis]SFL42831.1 Outer membrane protein TolC [Shimia haliotis]
MKKTGVCVLCLLLLGCEEAPQGRSLVTSSTPIVDSPETRQADADLSAEIAVDPSTLPGVSTGKVYTLPQLIDIAQSRNPVTRKTWLAARQAGQNVSAVRAATLPLVTASVIAGGQRFNTDVNPALLPPSTVSTDVSGVAAVVGVSWLLFDFGENISRQQAADQLARVAELQFNRAHLQLIFDVSSHYHRLDASQKKNMAATAATQRAEQLLEAANKRKGSGLGNDVEVAQAEQLLAQTRVVQSQVAGEVGAARVLLASALNLSPNSVVRIRPTTGRLPSPKSKTLETYVQSAMKSHPEVLAALAEVRAAQFDLDATAASYLPKIYGGANVLAGNSGLSINGFEPGGIGTTSSSGVFLGVTIPVFDGGLKETRLNNANSRISSAKVGVEIARSVTSREVGLAYQALKTSLAVHLAAQDLVTSAKRTADAAESAYAAGIGTISDASVAALNEFVAIEALADARAAVYISSAALALATGTYGN